MHKKAKTISLADITTGTLKKGRSYHVISVRHRVDSPVLTIDKKGGFSVKPLRGSKLTASDLTVADRAMKQHFGYASARTS